MFLKRVPGSVVQWFKGTGWKMSSYALGTGFPSTTLRVDKVSGVGKEGTQITDF